MIRPRPRAVLFFALSIIPAVLIVTGRPDFWYASFYIPGAVLAVIACDGLFILPRSRLLAELDCPARLYVGRPGAARLGLRKEDHSGSVRLEAILELTGEAADPIALSALLVEGLDLSFPIVPLQRGRLVLEAFWLRWSGPLGLVELTRREQVGQGIDVVTDVHGIYDAALQFFARDAVYGVKTQRQRGEGTEFDNLCEYAQGMDHRFIDWKHSARHRKLLCKEFRQERNHQIVLGFDTGHLMLEPIDGMPKLDHAIRAGLLLGWVSLYSGDLVGGCGFDVRFRGFLEPGRGLPYFTQFQRFTAGLDYRTEETNFTLGLAELNTRLKRRALVVIFTEFVDSVSAELLLESLQLLVRKHVVIFVTLRDPWLTGLIEVPPRDFYDVAEAVIGDDFLKERAIVLERVARLGVHCLDTPVEGVSAALLNRYLMVKQRGLL